MFRVLTLQESNTLQYSFSDKGLLTYALRSSRILQVQATTASPTFSPRATKDLQSKENKNFSATAVSHKPF